MKTVNLPLAGIAAVLISGAVGSSAVYPHSFPKLQNGGGVLVVPVQQQPEAGEKKEGAGAATKGGEQGEQKQGGQQREKGAVERGAGGGAERDGKGAANKKGSRERAEQGTRARRNIEIQRDRVRRGGGADVRIYSERERRRGSDRDVRLRGYSPGAGGCQVLLQRYRACVQDR